MSKQTLAALQEAINNHRLSLESTNPETVLVDWVVGYATMDGHDGFDYSYACAMSTPHGTLGLAQLTLDIITDELTIPADDGDDGDD